MTSHNQFIEECHEIRVLVETILPEDKAIVWMAAPNPMFGNITPTQMIMNGRGPRVKKVVEDAIEQHGLGECWHGTTILTKQPPNTKS